MGKRQHVTLQFHFFLSELLNLRCQKLLIKELMRGKGLEELSDWEGGCVGDRADMYIIMFLQISSIISGWEYHHHFCTIEYKKSLHIHQHTIHILAEKEEHSWKIRNKQLKILERTCGALFHHASQQLVLFSSKCLTSTLKMQKKAQRQKKWMSYQERLGQGVKSRYTTAGWIYSFPYLQLE